MTKDRANLKIAVLTDLHAAAPDKDGNIGSYFSTAPSMSLPDRDAALSLERLIERDGLTADYIVCCGDMADKANPSAMTYVWSKFHALAEKLGATPIATVGNHDIDSRYAYNEFDAKGMLHGLVPPYPLPEESDNLHYWARNFAVVYEERTRIVVLNSCAYHGINPKPDAPEYLHGRISTRTLHNLAEVLNKPGSARPINLLVCHHHPHKHLDIEDADYSSMESGEKLIDVLSSTVGGSWMIVHGHKHHPRLCWGAGGANAPLIFGAGSFSAKLYDSLTHKARNQFYIVNFLNQQADDLGLDLAGEIIAWDYGVGSGWEKARVGSGLPARSGFGLRPQMKATAREIAKFVASSGNLSTWSEVVSHKADLQFLLPMDVESLRQELRASGVQTSLDENGSIQQLVKS